MAGNQPDLAFIRSKISICEVANALGLKLVGRNTAHCWRTEKHKNGDRTASISFRKNRAKCHVCDSRSLSTLDLVSVHQDCKLLDAAKWICARFEVPSIPKGRKLIRSERWHIGRVGASKFPLEELVRSGLWASFNDASRAVLLPLLCFADPDSSEAQISYRGLARYSGKTSNNTIAGVIANLEQIGLLKVTRARNGSFRECSRYRLDWIDEHFQVALSECHESLKAERDSERALRAQRRLPKSNTLSTVVHCQQSARSTTVDCAVSEKQAE